MDSLRTSSLFHYPQKLDNLKKILSQGFKPNYCKEEYVISKENSFIVGIPMVSFCDIPLTRISNFKNRYNDYAIGLSKEWGYKNGLNPVLYATEKSDIVQGLQGILKQLEYATTEFSEILEKSGQKRNFGDGDCIARGFQNDDSELTNALRAMSRSTFLYDVRSVLFGFTKSYYGSYKSNKEQSNYEENEWRYVIKESNILSNNWIWGEDNYSAWRGQNKKNKPQSTFQSLKFEVTDVNFIILSNDKQIPKLIKYIKGLSEFGGGESIGSIQKDILISKIISMDRIKKDF